MNNNRLLSIDTLRGFDMMFIMGLAGVLTSLSQALPCGFMDAIADQMTHKEWNGFAFYDMIFPLFLFIAGISFPFSLEKSHDKGLSSRAIYLNILRRAVILVALGIIYNGFLKLNLDTARYTSVLGRIGIAWGIAAVLFINFSTKVRIAIASIILFGYALISYLCVAPDAPAGASSLDIEGSIVGYIDRLYLPGVLRDGTFDPIGLFSTLPAIVTAMLGMFAGQLVRDENKSGEQRSLLLLIMGISLVILGLVWNMWTPINKPLWSSSYVCFAGGLSSLLFALFYWIIDVKGWQKWTLFFRVIGLNSITIYMLQRIVNMRQVSKFFFGGAADILPDEWGKVLLAAGYLFVSWLVLYLLYRKKIFLKV